jgi:hypothetical protein
MLYIRAKDAEDGVEDDVREGERRKIGGTSLQLSPCKVLLKPLLVVLFFLPISHLLFLVGCYWSLHPFAFIEHYIFECGWTRPL